jgi:hypothetical protein
VGRPQGLTGLGPAEALPPVDQDGHHRDRHESDRDHRELHQVLHVLPFGRAEANLRVLAHLGD